MEHDDKPLPIAIRTLSNYSTKCHAYAKALHYKEVIFFFFFFFFFSFVLKSFFQIHFLKKKFQLEYLTSSSASTIESLISINNQLQQPDAAIGILKVNIIFFSFFFFHSVPFHISNICLISLFFILVCTTKTST